MATETDDPDSAKMELETKDVEAVFSVLKDSKRLLSLPPDTLKKLLHAQKGINAADVISQQIKVHLEDTAMGAHYYRYNACSDWLIPDAFYNDIELLSTLPGSTLSAVSFLIPRFFDLIGGYYRMSKFDFLFLTAPYGFAETCDKFDELLMKILLQHIKDCAQNDTSWDSQFLITDKILDSLKPDNIAMYTMERPGPNPVFKDLRRGDVFPRSARLLAEWHLREYGTMVAQKVAGDLLPSELVELIEERFYSKSFLTSLGI